MIEFRHVTKRFADGTVAVDDLSLVAPSHQITVLVGPSGCGKTTSLRMVNRMVDPSDGQILVDDEDIHALDAVRLRRGIGYVIQHAGLFPHKTVVDNIATVPKLLGWSRQQARQRALELIDQVGLEQQYAERYPAQLSGGQQQRVGVARALAADPPIMLMDEPFSAVDPVVRAQLQDEFLRLQRDLAKTIVFVTHDIDEAIKLGDNIVVLRVGGRLAQTDTPAGLLANPTDDFVAGFIGRDRGYRALSFVPGDDLRIQPLPDGVHVDTSYPYRRGGPLKAALDATLTAPGGRAVVVDERGTAVGVIDHQDVLAAVRRAETQRAETA
ncbi:MAG TPA: ABC transporter ATP-binding protein [Nocardioidaceae bacterium]|nr:ABC transporter ATP-binding protein [Nocardioidaceae bacterium]